MQLFLEVLFQVSVFAVNILSPLALALIVVGTAVANKSILKGAFFSGISVVVLYLVILGVQVKQIADTGASFADVFGNAQAVLGLIITIVLPVVVGVAVAFISNRRFKKIA